MNLLSAEVLELTTTEMTTSDGGSLAAIWYDGVFCAAAFVHGLYEFGQMAGEYQSSLAPCDKK
jgi:hypothetical protein